MADEAVCAAVPVAARRARPHYRWHRGRSLRSLRTTTPPSSSEPLSVRCLTSSRLTQRRSSSSTLRRNSSERGQRPGTRWVPARCLLQCLERGTRRMTRTERCSTSSTTETREDEGAIRMGRWKTRIPPSPATTSSSSPTPRHPRRSPTPRQAMTHNKNIIGPPESSSQRGGGGGRRR